MNDRRGANVAALEELSRMFNKHSRNLEVLIKDLNGRMVGSTETWWGPGADRFRSTWQEAKNAFDKMAVALDQGSQDIKKSKQNIENATR